MSWLETLRTELAFSQLRFRNAIKTGIACIIGFWFTQYWRPDHPYWLPVSILIVSLPSYGATVQKGALRVLTTIGGMGCAMGIISLFSQNPVCYILAFIVYLTAVNALGRAGWNTQAMQLAAVYSSFLAAYGVLDPAGAPAFFYDRCIDVIAGVLIAWLVNRLIWPTYDKHTLAQTLQSSLRPLAAQLRELAVDRPIEVLQDEKITALLDRAGWEAIHHTVPKSRWTRLILPAQNLATTVMHLRRRWTRIADAPRLAAFRTQLESVLAEAANLLEGVIEQLEGNSAPAKPDLEALRHQVQSAFQTLRSASRADPLPSEQLTAASMVVNQTEEALLYLEQLQGAPEGRDDTLPDQLPRLHIDLPVILQSVKMPVCLLLTAWFVWAIGLKSVLLTAVISAAAGFQATIGASYRKLALRLGGCLLGGGIALAVIVWFIPHFEGGIAMSLMLGLITSFAAYLYFASARYNYIGMQTGLVALLVLDTGYAPSVDLEPVWQRFVGIVFAALMVALVSRCLFPIRSYDVYRKCVATWLDAMRNLVDLEFRPWIAEENGWQQARQKLRQAWGARGRFEQLWLEARAESSRAILRSRALPEHTATLVRATIALLGPQSRDAEIARAVQRYVGAEAEALSQTATRLLEQCALPMRQHASQPPPEIVLEPLLEAISRLREKLAALRIEKAFRAEPDHVLEGLLTWIETVITASARLRDIGERTAALDFEATSPKTQPGDFAGQPAPAA